MTSGRRKLNQQQNISHDASNDLKLKKNHFVQLQYSSNDLHVLTVAKSGCVKP